MKPSLSVLAPLALAIGAAMFLTACDNDCDALADEISKRAAKDGLTTAPCGKAEDPDDDAPGYEADCEQLAECLSR